MCDILGVSANCGGYLKEIAEIPSHFYGNRFNYDTFFVACPHHHNINHI